MRKRMVTRTIIGTKVTCLAMDVLTAEPETKTYVLGEDFKDNEKALKAVKKVYDTDTFKVVAVTEMEKVEKRYGMDEAEFIENAEELPPLPGNKED